MKFKDAKLGTKLIRCFLDPVTMDFNYSLYEITEVNNFECQSKWLEHHTLTYQLHTGTYIWRHGWPDWYEGVISKEVWNNWTSGEVEATEESIKAAQEQLIELMLRY